VDLLQPDPFVLIVIVLQEFDFVEFDQHFQLLLVKLSFYHFGIFSLCLHFGQFTFQVELQFIVEVLLNLQVLFEYINLPLLFLHWQKVEFFDGAVIGIISVPPPS
jgi:hypothetical protein